MYDQPVSPDKKVYAVYIVEEPTGRYLPVTWFDEEVQAQDFKTNHEPLGGHKHELKFISYGEFMRDYLDSNE